MRPAAEASSGRSTLASMIASSFTLAVALARSPTTSNRPIYDIFTPAVALPGIAK